MTSLTLYHIIDDENFKTRAFTLAYANSSTYAKFKSSSDIFYLSGIIQIESENELKQGIVLTSDLAQRKSDLFGANAWSENQTNENVELDIATLETISDHASDYDVKTVNTDVYDSASLRTN